MTGRKLLDGPSPSQTAGRVSQRDVPTAPLPVAEDAAAGDVSQAEAAKRRVVATEASAAGCRAEYDKQFKLTALMLLGFSILAGLASLIWREYIPINNGFGWDGYYFMPMFYDFPFFFFKHGFDAYHIQRILPVGDHALRYEAVSYSSI